MRTQIENQKNAFRPQCGVMARHVFLLPVVAFKNPIFRNGLKIGNLVARNTVHPGVWYIAGYELWLGPERRVC